MSPRNGPPKEVEAGAPHHQDDRPTTTTRRISSHHTTDRADNTKQQPKSPGAALVRVPCHGPRAPQDVPTQLRRRRAAVQRMPGSDPWCYEPPGVRGYPETAQHLLAHGLTPAPNLPALQAMWKAGDDDLNAARTIAERWGLAE
jgi:hypothetical protein